MSHRRQGDGVTVCVFKDEPCTTLAGPQMDLCDYHYQQYLRACRKADKRCTFRDCTRWPDYRQGDTCGAHAKVEDALWLLDQDPYEPLDLIAKRAGFCSPSAMRAALKAAGCILPAAAHEPNYV